MHLSRRTCLALGVTLSLSACFGSSSPFSVVKDFYTAVANGEVDQAIKLIAFEQVSVNEIPMVQSKVRMMIAQSQSMAQTNGGLNDIMLLNEEIADNNESARVRVEVRFNNGKTKQESFNLRKKNGDWKIRL